eukprot:s1194_g8.t1
MQDSEDFKCETYPLLQCIAVLALLTRPLAPPSRPELIQDEGQMQRGALACLSASTGHDSVVVLEHVGLAGDVVRLPRQHDSGSGLEVGNVLLCPGPQVAICPLRWAGVVADVKVVELGSDPSCPPRDASGHCFDLLHKTRRWLAVEDEEDSEVEHLLPGTGSKNITLRFAHCLAKICSCICCRVFGAGLMSLEQSYGKVDTAGYGWMWLDAGWCLALHTLAISRLRLRNLHLDAISMAAFRQSSYPIMEDLGSADFG